MRYRPVFLFVALALLLAATPSVAQVAGGGGGSFTPNADPAIDHSGYDPSILTEGDSTADLTDSGTGDHSINVDGVLVAMFQSSGGTDVNYLHLSGNTAGLSPKLAAAGGDANIDLVLAPKGAGRIRNASGAMSIDSVGAMNIYVATALQAVWDGTRLSMSSGTDLEQARSNGWYLEGDVDPSATVPNIGPRRFDRTTGMGSAATGEFSLIAASVANLRGTADGPDFEDPGTKPTCTSAERGIFFFDEGGAGVADTIEICAKNAADAYAWVALASP